MVKFGWNYMLQPYIESATALPDYSKPKESGGINKTHMCTHLVNYWTRDQAVVLLNLRRN